MLIYVKMFSVHILQHIRGEDTSFAFRLQIVINCIQNILQSIWLTGINSQLQECLQIFCGHYKS